MCTIAFSWVFVGDDYFCSLDWFEGLLMKESGPLDALKQPYFNPAVRALEFYMNLATTVNAASIVSQFIRSVK